MTIAAEEGEIPPGQTGFPVMIVPMTRADVKEVHAIERDCFPSPWPRRAFLMALKKSDATFFTALAGGTVVGYAGMRLGYSAHIINMAVHRDYRRKKIGSRLLSVLLDAAARRGAKSVTLEVRVSNAAAQSMYRKFRFAPVAVKRGYYTRENEDAIVMAREIGEGNHVPC